MFAMSNFPPWPGPQSKFRPRGDPNVGLRADILHEPWRSLEHPIFVDFPAMFHCRRDTVAIHLSQKKYFIQKFIQTGEMDCKCWVY